MPLSLVSSCASTRASGIPQHELQEPDAYGWKAHMSRKSPSNSESSAMSCFGTNETELRYLILENGSVLTVSQVNGLAYGSSDSSRSSYSSGAASPSIDDPNRSMTTNYFPSTPISANPLARNRLESEALSPSRAVFTLLNISRKRQIDFMTSISPAPDSGSTSSCRKREIGMIAEKRTMHAENKSNT